MPVILPPLTEQQTIASFLDRECGKIDALIAEQERLIALLAEKRQAVISHAVTKGLNPNAPMKNSGIPWIGMVPEGWEMMRVKNILSTIEQGWSPQCENYPRSSDAEWAVLKVGCVNTGIFNPSENKVLPETLDGNENLQVRVGDLLVSRANTRDLVGRSAVAERNYSHLMICDKIFRLRTRPDLCFPEYLSLFLQSFSGRHVIELAASGASQSMVNIGQGTILEMFFPVPPLETQRHILQNLNYNEEAEAIKNADQFINLARERRAALISAAVTGKIDVRAQSKARAA
ncbi:restriction endonuclease subunit S [Novacetimonas hansenii]|nr:restriction endonuclease subunit S [Novacetimonas hansenii]